MRLENWGVRGLVGSWFLYWTGLAAVTIGPALWKYLTVQITGGHGTASVSFSGSVFELASWIAGPPLALTAVWLLTRPRRDAALPPSDVRKLGERPPAGFPHEAEVEPRAPGQEIPVRGPTGDVRR